MAYSACRQCSLILLKILLGHPYSAGILLGIRKNCRALLAVFLFANSDGSLGLTLKSNKIFIMRGIMRS